MSSTETGHIFGTIVYENSSTAEKTYINLNDIHMDIMDYIKPASCSEEAFRSMWAEFEWENKVGCTLRRRAACLRFVSYTPLASTAGELVCETSFDGGDLLAQTVLTLLASSGPFHPRKPISCLCRLFRGICSARFV